MYEFCVMRYNLQYKTYTQKAQIAAAETETETAAMAKAAAAFLRVCSEIHYCSFIAVFPIRSFMLRYCCFFFIYVCLPLYVSIRFISFCSEFFFFFLHKLFYLCFKMVFGVRTKHRPNNNIYSTKSRH